VTFPAKDIPETQNGVRGRLAPSPTGLLHLGNAWAFWVAWLDARSREGECVLRLEDIDPARSRMEYAEALTRDLAWLGIEWDYGPGAKNGKDNVTVFFQSKRDNLYQDALRFLAAKGLVYPCYCTRKELRDIAGAPHVDNVGAPYPGSCRTLSDAAKERHEAAGRRHSLRLLCSEGTRWRFTDILQGNQDMTLEQCGGDFALRRSDGVFAYQLAVVVDDIAMGITRVVRGKDILVSTPRQLYLYDLFGAQEPDYAHLPLVVDNFGERLAKRHASLTLAALRQAGVRAETLLGWFAAAAGMRERFAPLHAHEGIKSFNFSTIRAEHLRLPSDPVAFFLTAQQTGRYCGLS